MAYAGLADTYLTGTSYGYYPREKSIPKSKAYALKALAYDNSLAEPHATLGGMATYYEYNWDVAEKELKRAMKIDPNYARAYKLYSEFMDIIGNREEARKYINKALEYNPTYTNMLLFSYNYYYNDANYDKAFGESFKIYELDKNDGQYLSRNFLIYLLQHKYLEALNEYKKILTINNSVDRIAIIDSLTRETEPKDVISQLIDIKKDNIGYGLTIAQYLLIIHGKEAALDYLEESYSEGQVWIIRIKSNIAFENLREEPRFLALLDSMNLGGY